MEHRARAGRILTIALVAVLLVATGVLPAAAQAQRPVLRVALAFLFLANLLSTANLGAQELRVLPVDEAAQDPGFFAFRARLQRAIAERDTATLLAAVHPDIKLSLGPGHSGIEDFREEWLADTSVGIWAELGAVLALGGRFYGDSTFVAPYTFGDLPDEIDPFEALIALGASVPVHAAPDSNAEVVAVLSFDVVLHAWDLLDPVPSGWTVVRLEGGTIGYVRSRSVRSPVYYRASFDRRDGRWRMTSFIAGD